ncbi:MAG: transketolase C-terminal domain-containing protein [Actinomycetaceae bacterium]|nr:transketolase C-terminal domain-containing protein [Actinomycetaceae bacterium]MDY5854001.1 transketolase C-terminal domain-containing protein [Arcanobacterium sp.]
MAGGLAYTSIDAVNLTTAEVYGQTLVEIGKNDPKVVGLSADLAKSTKIAVFQKEFPERFFNFGIAEQNMFGAAAGLAKSGLTPFVSTFGAFAALRSCEQIRTDICYQNLNVKIIGTHSGLSFGAAGTTHHVTEDISIFRSFANLTLMCPADGLEAAYCVQAAYEHEGPVYIRLNRGFDQVVYRDEIPSFEFGKANVLREGTDLTFIATGTGVWRALQAADALSKEDGLSVRVLDIHTLKPIDEEAVTAAISETRRIITVEDHNVIGGLGTAVADVGATTRKGFVLKKLGVPDEFSVIGLPEDLYSHYGYDENGCISAAREVMSLDFEEDDDWEDEF